MAGSTTYIEPSVNQNEVLVPTGINIPAQPFALCLVGTGSLNKRIVNEPVFRGVVKAEALTLAGTAPHTATLANRSTKNLDDLTVYRTLNGISTPVLDQYISFNPAFVLGTVTSTVDLNPDGSVGARTNAIGLEMDGITPVTIRFFDSTVLTAGASPGADFDFTESGGIVTLDLGSSADLLNKGVRPGHVVTIAGADTANNGAHTILSVTASAITYADDAATVENLTSTATATFSGTAALGRELTIFHSFGGVNAASATMAEIAAAINAALSSTAGTTLGFGSAYSAVATVSSSALLITSPLSSSNPASDVRVWAPVTDSGVNAIFGAAGASNRDARSVISISALAYNASATWTIDYCTRADVTNLADPLSIASAIQTLVRVGSTKGGSEFSFGTSYQLTSNEVDWTPVAAASTSSLVGVPQSTYDLDPAYKFAIEIDEKTSTITGSTRIPIVLSGLVPAPLNYVEPSSLAAATATEVARNINAILASHLGPKYASVASVVSSRVVLTSPEKGQAASFIRVLSYDPASDTNAGAEVAIFGATGIEVHGTGLIPSVGQPYYVTFDYTRPSSEYDVPVFHTSVQAAQAHVGAPSVSTAGYNPLALAIELAWKNGVEFLYTVLIDDTDNEGNPSTAAIRNALNGAATIEEATEILVIGEPGTRLQTAVDKVAHLEEQNSSTEKHPRRGFFGMAAGTSIGDKNTTNSLIGRATGTLQVAATSPARGRMFLVEGPQLAAVTYTTILEDGSTARLSMDNTYVAAAVAARRSVLAPADTLTGKSIYGFDVDSVTAPWKPAERRRMLGNGVMVVAYKNGQFKVIEGISTEAGGGNKLSFKVDSTSYQKDIVVTKVNKAIDENLKGFVPFDIASFLLEIKLVIQSVITQEITNKTIGPFRNGSTGETRPIELRTDIIVSQNPDDKTQYDFNYWFVLRYPALRFFGQYSVDAAAFSLTDQA